MPHIPTQHTAFGVAIVCGLWHGDNLAVRESAYVSCTEELKALIQRSHIAASMQDDGSIQWKDMAVVHQILDAADLIDLVITQPQTRQVSLFRQRDGLVAEIAVIGHIAQKDAGRTSVAVMQLQVFLRASQPTKRSLGVQHTMHTIGSEYPACGNLDSSFDLTHGVPCFVSVR